jgi:hypothetical protein
MMTYAWLEWGNMAKRSIARKKCLEIAHVYNDQQDIGLAYNILGMIGWVRGDSSSALLYFEQSLAQLEKIHPPMSIGGFNIK